MHHELFEPVWTEHGFGTRLQDFQKLMKHRIRDVLLVSSLFDLYLFEEEGRLYDQIQDEYQGLQLTHAPDFTRVSKGLEAIELLEEGSHFDLVLMTLHIEDMKPLRLAREIRKTNLEIPIVLLAYDNRELNDLVTRHDSSVFDRTFVWQGDVRLLIAIVKDLEDRMNVERDTSLFGVQCILLVEDSIRHYSFFLPILYAEVINHSQRLISEGLNSAHRSLRMRARPKIILCTTYEEAWRFFKKYQGHITGIVSDAGFPRGGDLDPRAGLDLAKKVRSKVFDIPILLQSTNKSYRGEALEIGAHFLDKNSPSFVEDFRRALRDRFSFGDFIFRMPDETEVGRASDLKSLERQLHLIPEESFRYHAERNHFSNWLKARTEFRLAFRLRPRRVEDYDSIEELRKDVIRLLHEHRSIRQRGMVTEFSFDTFDPSSSFARIGTGSLGGKARGLAFVNAMMSSYMVRQRFADVEIEVPAAVVIGTDVFDEFLEGNDLRDFALSSRDDDEILRRFVAAENFPDEAVAQLTVFLQLCQDPIAVRSSSLLEDSQYHPFAGVYQTYMIPNRNKDLGVRVDELLNTIKRVYASTFYRSARDYIKVIALRVEDEKMAVIVQKMVGATHSEYFYPEIAGVARSYNFYPVGPQKPEDGIASVALGLGKTIVEGGIAVRFCPKYPNHVPQFSSTRAAIRNNQREFYALDLEDSPLNRPTIEDELLKRVQLDRAERDGTLHIVASTYSVENDALYDGMSRKGTRLVTFAPILNSKAVPLAEIVEFLSDLGSWGMGTPVEIEFAMNLSVPPGERHRFGVLQMRPLVLSRETEELSFGEVPESDLICMSDQVLGHGVIRDIKDVVVVDKDRFERSHSRDVAKEVSEINARLLREGRSYLLVGSGRWGTLDPWLGIPVKWSQISGARAIVEAGFRDMNVDPSQGSHFFQNLTAFQVGYFTITSRQRTGFVDWDWLSSQEAITETRFVRHLRFDDTITIKIDGHHRVGIIQKPDSACTGRTDEEV